MAFIKGHNDYQKKDTNLFIFEYFHNKRERARTINRIKRNDYEKKNQVGVIQTMIKSNTSGY